MWTGWGGGWVGGGMGGVCVAGAEVVRVGAGGDLEGEAGAGEGAEDGVEGVGGEDEQRALTGHPHRHLSRDRCVRCRRGWAGRGGADHAGTTR